MDYPERLDRQSLEQLQQRKLQRLFNEVIPRNPFWKNKFAEGGFPQSINSLSELTRLPLTSKQELVEDQLGNPPYGTNLTFERQYYTRCHQSSGTTGQPQRWLDTPESWNWFLECWSQIYRIAGINSDDRFCFPFSFGPFIGFWAGFEGAASNGNFCLPAGGLSSEARLKLIIDHEITVVCCTPTYALRLSEVARSQNIDLTTSFVRALIVAGEPGGAIPAIRNQLEQSWGARVIDHWGMTDIGSLGVEAVDDPGDLLILETECIAEIIDPNTFKPVDAGQKGELVITNLGRIGMPVIRYRTGDIVRAKSGGSSAGYELLCLEGGIIGRADDMITIRGNNVFPSSIEAILREFAEVVEYRVTVSRRDSMHHIKIEVETVFSNHSDTESLLESLKHEIKDRLQFQADCVAVDQNSLPRFEMKGRRFVIEN